MRQLRVNISDETMSSLDALVAKGTDDRSYYVRLALNEFLSKVSQPMPAVPVAAQQPEDEPLSPEDQALLDKAMRLFETERAEEKRKTDAKEKLDALSEDLLSMENMQL
jgi:hypothetical protein